MEKVYLISGCRTAIGTFGGTLKGVSAVKLGATAIKEAVRRAEIQPNSVNEVIIGNVLQAGMGQNTARQAAVGAGIPFEVPSMVINKVCGSGLSAVNLATQIIKLGDADCIVAGGIENMSAAPFVLKKHRWGNRMSNDELIDEMILGGLWDIFYGYHMGITAENIAQKYGITRAEQDNFAYDSQMKNAKAVENGKFNDEIVSINIPQKKDNDIKFIKDEHPRPDTSLEKLSKLKPAFKENGTVTAGNSSGINDGAAAVIVANKKFILKHKIKPLAEVISYGSVGVDPAIMGIGPVPAVKKALDRVDIRLNDIDLIELNEAFASQSIAVIRELELNMNIVNVNGGAIALGHPIGASGTRILVTLIYEMIRREVKYGLATLCIGGGMGETTIIKRI